MLTRTPATMTEPASPLQLDDVATRTVPIELGSRARAKCTDAFVQSKACVRSLLRRYGHYGKSPRCVGVHIDRPSKQAHANKRWHITYADDRRLHHFAMISYMCVHI